MIRIEDSASGGGAVVRRGSVDLRARGSTHSNRSTSQSIDIIAVVVQSSAGVATLATGMGSTVLATDSDVPIDTGGFETAPVAARAADEDSPFCTTNEQTHSQRNPFGKAT